MIPAPATSGFRAVMQRRVLPSDDLEFFPTPPWATRALVKHVIRPLLPGVRLESCRAVDPCCGEGHMIETLAESFGATDGADVFDYGRGYAVRDALERDRFAGLDDAYVCTNPPFSAALALALAALERMDRGGPRSLFLFVRTNFLEGCERYERLFRERPPSVVAHFVERVALVKGRYDPDASTATAYAWLGWHGALGRAGRTIFIPPCRRELETKADIRRWCQPADAPLFAEASI